MEIRAWRLGQIYTFNVYTRLGQIITFNVSKTINTNYGLSQRNICNVNIKLHDIINTNNTVHGLTYNTLELAQTEAQIMQIMIQLPSR